jgi:hypothetical protein
MGRFARMDYLKSAFENIGAIFYEIVAFYYWYFLAAIFACMALLFIGELVSNLIAK